jgi:hypothetical protein
MLCYSGMGNEKMAKQHEVRYLRFKADESAQAITGPYRQLNPEDNNDPPAEPSAARQQGRQFPAAPNSHPSVIPSAARNPYPRQWF